MKLIFIVVTFVTLVSAELETWDIVENEAPKIVNINKHVDNCMPNISQLIIQRGLDPLKLPPAMLKIFTQHPKPEPTKNPKAYITLNSGLLSRLSILERYDNAIITYENKIVKVDLGVNFKQLNVVYNYFLKILFVKKSGRIDASAQNVHAKIAIIFNATDYTLTLNKFEAAISGRLTVIMWKKNGKKDRIATAVVKILNSYLKKKITEVAQREMMKMIKTYISEINRKISRKKLTYTLEYKLLNRLRI